MKIKSLDGQISEKDVLDIEELTGVILPADYRHYLLTYNVWVPKNEILFFLKYVNEISSNDEANDSLGFFLGVSSDSSWDLRASYSSKQYGEEFLTIAEDSGGNNVLMKIRGTEVGSIFFADHEVEYREELDGDDEYDGYAELCKLADNFQSFVDSFVEDESEYQYAIYSDGISDAELFSRFERAFNLEFENLLDNPYFNYLRGRVVSEDYKEQVDPTYPNMTNIIGTFDLVALAPNTKEGDDGKMDEHPNATWHFIIGKKILSETEVFDKLCECDVKFVLL